MAAPSCCSIHAREVRVLPPAWSKNTPWAWVSPSPGSPQLAT
ncbi:MAG: hypothetical protein NUV77_24925 [Thermoguttaceae bacterium]|nr:hypothetical protein [Thermoguttaceae bacterium]